MMDIAKLEEFRKAAFEGEDRDLYLHIGYFMMWYSAVEMRITMLLRVVTQSPNAEGFELLTKGMDARTKCERLRAGAVKNAPLGDVFSQRLDIFERKAISLRNKVAHSFIVSPPDGDAIHFTTISRLPYKAFGREQKGAEPERITKKSFFEHAVWTNTFAHDVRSASLSLVQNNILEITNPISPEQLAGYPQPQTPVEPSKPGRRARKRARKGHPPRGGACRGIVALRSTNNTALLVIGHTPTRPLCHVYN